MNYVSWKDRKAAADVKPIYRAATADAAAQALADFRQRWPKHQMVADVTTNAVESLHMTLRKVTKNRGSVPNEEATFKLLYLAIKNVSAKWSTVMSWREALPKWR